MTEPMAKEIIRSLAFNMPAEQIAVAMGVTVEEISVVAVTRKLDIIEERVFCEGKGAIYD